MYLKKVTTLIKQNKNLLFSSFAWVIFTKIVAFKLKTWIKPCNHSRNNKLIVHACHHKVMTVYFHNTFRLIAFALNLKYQHCKQSDLSSDTNIFLEDHSHIDVSKLPNFVGTHIVRDPRDILISAYFYHKWCNELWANQIDKDGITYQQKLNAVHINDGLLLEISRLSTGEIRDIRDWNYNDINFLELKYEELVSPNESLIFSRIFSHYGFEGAERALCIDIMKLLSFRSRTGRNVGQFNNKSHLRNGKPGQWRAILNDAHKQYIKTLFGDVLINLEYESDDSW